MTLTRYRILITLRRAVRPLSLAEIVAATGMRTGTVSMQLTRCHRSGLIARREHVAWLTPKGAKRVDWVGAFVFGDVVPVTMPTTDGDFGG